MSRLKADRGIYRVAPCTCPLLPKKHDTFDVVVGAGRDPRTGRYRQVWERHHGNLTTAREARRVLLGKVRSGEHRRTSAYVADLFDQWLADLERLDRAPKTIKEYRADADRYWLPAIGDLPVHKVTLRHLRDVMNDLQDRGLSASTRRHVKACVSGAFSWAMREEWISRDPTKLLRVTGSTNRLPDVPTPEQIRLVLDEAARSERPEMGRFIFLGAVMGARSSELRGLKVGDVDLAAGLVGIARAMSAEQEWATKNRKDRPVGLDALTVAVVATQLDYMRHRARTLKVRLREDAYLFSDDGGRTHWREETVTRFVSTLFDHAGRDDGEPCDHDHGERCPRPGPLAHFTFKHLRKFMDTHGQHLGFTTNEVAARAGHDPSVARKHYTGSIASRDRELSAGLAKLLLEPDPSATTGQPDSVTPTNESLGEPS